MKLRRPEKALKALAARIKAWEQACQNGKSNPDAYRKPGRMKP